MKNNYTKFAAMIATSTLVMFGLMYLNTYALGHIFFSETRAYMALLMGATMAVIMLGFMLNMYESQSTTTKGGGLITIPPEGARAVSSL